MNIPVTLYTKATCPYCIRAKQLLNHKGVTFTEIDMPSISDEERSALAQKTNNYRTVPQIFIGEKFIGGCDDLTKLEQSGQLDVLLAG